MAQSNRGDRPSPIEIEKYLKGFDYPAEKEDLVRHAESQGAPAEVLEILNKLPGGEYGRPTDVTKAMKEAA